ncbi:MAG TPA: YiaA/YiaB family inner membrane protein, partial [Niastella sp.]
MYSGILGPVYPFYEYFICFEYIFIDLKKHPMNQKPSNAFIAASWIALGAGMAGFLIGLWRAEMLLNEKGYYFTVLMFGLFAVISVQKS